MKLHLFKQIIIFFFLGITSLNAQSWITRRICTNRGYSYHPVIAVNGSNVFIVWDDDTLGNSEIFLRSSKNGGSTWSLQKNISNTPGISWMPDIISSGLYIYIVWEDYDETSKIFFMRSKDGGQTWSNPKSIASALGMGGWSSISAIQEQVFVAWGYDLNINGNYEIYFSSSNDAGLSWTPVKRISYSSGMSYWPEIYFDGTRVYSVWMEMLYEGNNQISFKRSINGGQSWKGLINLSPASSDSWWPRMTVVDPNIYIVWGNYSNNQANGVCLKRSFNRGASWTTTDFFDTRGGDVDIAALGKKLFVVWEDRGLVYCKSNDQGESWAEPVKLSHKVAGMPRITVNENSRVYIVYAEPLASNYEGNWDIYLKYTKDMPDQAHNRNH